MTIDSGQITRVLRAVRNGDSHAADRLFEEVYGELRRIAAGQRFRWQGNETMSTTALVHEAYIKLVKQDEVDWQDRSHFFAVAARAMRHILIDYAEQRAAAKRGGRAVHVPLDNINPVPEDAAEDLLDLHDALNRLAEDHDRPSRVVECRFFGGLTIRETAETLAVSDATVERDWAFASAWLKRALSGRPPSPE